MRSPPEEHAFYDEDLAFIQAAGFGELAAAAIAAVIPTLKARGAQRVIDVGCGAGVSTKLLVAAGFDTLAIEPSASLLELARQAAPLAEFRQASAYEVALDGCDAILAIGEGLTYHAPTEDAEARLRSFFGSASRALQKGGLMAFDLIETGDESLTARAWKAGPDWAVLSASEEDAELQQLTRNIETFRHVGGGSYRRRSEVHHVRLFERSAVSSWLEQAGFEVETATAYGSFALPRRRVAFFATRR
jgi:cyclopropane fatty-acyl-phospholipid synthase-like methyltransferase